MTTNDVATLHPQELNISRLVEASPELLFRGWTEPALLMQWFTPAPWKTIGCEIDLHPGGRFDTLMQSPEGQEFWHRGVFLEIVPNQKIVSTDALVSGWIPSAKPFAVLTVTFDKEGTRTRYTGRASHWTEADRDSHASMGFYEGWHKALDQLLDLVRIL
ncbi:MAG: SRPBCC family protein [Planctomycetaceae bacterium]|nr:SRPBCC family protein [Planctomycetaceae bacterium]